MIKLVITNGWSDLNAGDSAIIMSIIKRFEMEYGDNLYITVLSELNYKNEYYNGSIDKIKEVFPHIEVELISSPFYKTYKKNILNKIKEGISFIIAIFRLIFLKKTYSGNNLYFNKIRDADIIISKGGHFIHDRKGINSIIHLLKCLYPLMVADKLSKNYFLIAQSFGPFYQDSLLSKLNTILIKKYLNNASSISVREEISYEAMKNIDINENIMNKTSDYAFLINQVEYKYRHCQKIKDKYIVVTLRQHNFKEMNGEFAYLNNVRKLCNHIYDKYNIKTLIVPHVKGPNDFENDIFITKKFENMLNEDEVAHYIFNYQYMHAKELVQLYSDAEILIGTRFHSVIFALSKNIPTLAISYSGYKANIMRQFEMNDFMINIEEVNDNNYTKIKNMTEKLLDEKDVYKKLINLKLKEVLISIIEDDTFKKIKDIINKKLDCQQ